MSKFNRINIIGTSGSGKSYFAVKLAQKTLIPYIEMDRIFWGPNWYWPTDEEFFAKLNLEITGDKWVLAGNYTRTIPLKWERTELVVWIDLPFYLTIYQAVSRAIYRCISRKEIWPDTGNKESFKQSFLSRDSIIWWTVKTYKKNKIKFEGFMKNPKYEHIKFIRLRSRKEMKQFIEKY